MKAKKKTVKKKPVKLSATEQKIRELQAEANKLKQAEDKKKTDKLLAKLDVRAKVVWELLKDELQSFDDDDLEYLTKGFKLNLSSNTHKPYFVCEFYSSPTGRFLFKDEAIDWVEDTIKCGDTKYLVIDVDNQKQVEVKMRVEFV